MTKKLVVEAIGTFFLVFTISLVATASSPSPFAALAIGSVLMVMVYAGGHISGAHYNPAVTLAVFLRGKATMQEMFGYWVAQLIGGGVAGGLGRFFAEAKAQPGLIDQMYAGLAEFIFTFALAYVVLNVATTRGNEGNSYYGLAIGFTLFVGAIAAGPISGGAFNPAVAVGLAILGAVAAKSVPMYLVATLAGGAAAAFVFRVLDLGNDKPTTAGATQGDLVPPASTGKRR